MIDPDSETDADPELTKFPEKKCLPYRFCISQESIYGQEYILAGSLAIARIAGRHFMDNPDFGLTGAHRFMVKTIDFFI